MPSHGTLFQPWLKDIIALSRYGDIPITGYVLMLSQLKLRSGIKSQCSGIWGYCNPSLMESLL